MHAVEISKTKPTWFIFDTEAIPMIDITGCEALAETKKIIGKERNYHGIGKSQRTF